MSKDKLNNFVPLNIELAERIGLVDAAVAGAIWLKWNIHKKVCNAGTRELGRMIGKNASTVSRSIQRLIDLKLVEDLSPDRNGAPHDLVPSVALRNTLCKRTVAQCNTTVAECNSSGESVAECNKEEESNNSNNNTLSPAAVDEKNREFALKVIEVCSMESVFLTDPAISELNDVSLWLRKKGATISDLDYFKTDYWWGKTPPLIPQIKKYWAECKAKQKGEVENAKRKNGTRKVYGNRTKQSSGKYHDPDQAPDWNPAAMSIM